MKTILTLISAFTLSAFPLFGLTTFTFEFDNSDGTPNTNAATMIGWPITQNSIVVYGSKIVNANRAITLQAGTNGLGTNAAMPNYYRVTENFSDGTTVSFFANIPDTTNVFALANYVTNAPVIFTPASMFAFLTNQLGGAVGLIQALQYTPLTNSFAAVTNVLGYKPLTNTFGAITNALAYQPLTNTLYAITNLTDVLVTAHPASITNALGFALVPPTFAALTNIFGYWPATNTPAGIAAAQAFASMTNSFAAVTNALGYQPLTNTFAAITNALGYFPGTNYGYPQFTGIIGYTNSSGTASRLYITNSLVITNTTP